MSCLHSSDKTREKQRRHQEVTGDGQMECPKDTPVLFFRLPYIIILLVNNNYSHSKIRSPSL